MKDEPLSLDAVRDDSGRALASRDGGTGHGAALRAALVGPTGGGPAMGPASAITRAAGACC